MKILPALLVLALCNISEAAVSISVLDQGIQGGTNTITTNSVTPTNGSLLVLFVGNAIQGTISGRGVSGLSLTWTQAAIASTFPSEVALWRAVASGTSGTITATITSGSTMRALSYTLLEVDGANQTTGQGVVRTVTGSSAGASSPAGVSLAIGTYVDPHNAIISSGVMGIPTTATTLTFAQDPDAGWASATFNNKIFTGAVGFGHGTQWLLLNTSSDASADSTWTWNNGGTNNQSVLNAEIASGGAPKVKVTQ